VDILLLGGSLRPGSLNGRLLQHLEQVLEAEGHRTSAWAGEALRWPLLEEGAEPPGAVSALAGEMRSAQGLVIVSPEYNAGIPGHLKNAVDWLSVQAPNPWDGLPVLLCACSPGALGGARVLVPWRLTLANVGAIVLPRSVTVPHADQSLGPGGGPEDPRTREILRSALAAFLSCAGRLKPGKA